MLAGALWSGAIVIDHDLLLNKRKLSPPLIMARDILLHENQRILGIQNARIAAGLQDRIPDERAIPMLGIGAAVDGLNFTIEFGRNLRDPLNPPKWLIDYCNQVRAGLLG
jgi:hypothetical protein